MAEDVGRRSRDLSIGIIRSVGVDTGGCNIQFAVNPADGRIVVIEMNPRVSRSSALASKATGFPIAKFAAKLAVGYTLDELYNDITKVTPASFEPAALETARTLMLATAGRRADVGQAARVSRVVHELHAQRWPVAYDSTPSLRLSATIVGLF